MEDNNQKSISVGQNTVPKIGVVKTYAEDMTQAIERNEGGMIKKIIHEQEEREEVKKNVSPESKRNKFFMLIGLVLVLSAFFILVFLVVFKNQIYSVSVTPKFTPLVFTDQTEYKEIVGLTKDKIGNTILNEINSTNVKSGGVEGLYLTENQKIIGLRRFISLMKGNLVVDQTSLVDDNFMIGIANEEKKDLFILLKARSFADIFPVMKNWENKLFSDLHSLFNVDINGDTNYLLTKDFEDGIVGNKNTRILHDKDGKIVLEYVFADDNYVIVANSDQAVQEIMQRLASAQIKK